MNLRHRLWTTLGIVAVLTLLLAGSVQRNAYAYDMDNGSAVALQINSGGLDGGMQLTLGNSTGLDKGNSLATYTNLGVATTTLTAFGDCGGTITGMWRDIHLRTMTMASHAALNFGGMLTALGARATATMAAAIYGLQKNSTLANLTGPPLNTTAFVDKARERGGMLAVVQHRLNKAVVAFLMPATPSYYLTT